MGCLQSKAQAEGGAESTSGLPPAPGGDGSPTTVILSEKATIEERAESLAKRWCACEAMMLQPSMEPERGKTEPELGVGVGDKLESHGGMVHVPRGEHGKAEVVAADGQSLPTPEALNRLELKSTAHYTAAMSRPTWTYFAAADKLTSISMAEMKAKYADPR